MAYLLNSVDLFTTYGIYPGQAPGSNIAMSGIFDLPSRNGKTHHSWGDDHGIEPYVDSGDIQFAGRDIVFHGFLTGESSNINARIRALKDAIKAFSTLVVLSTPYGDFTVSVKEIQTKMYHGASSVIITFREPVVTLTGGTLPAEGASSNTIDGRTMLSFGLYLSGSKELHNLPEMKEQYFTKYGSEGYQISKRKNETLSFDGFIIGSSLADFKSKISALYLLFSSAGLRSIVLNNEISVACFATEGFKITNVVLGEGIVIGRLNCSLLCTNITDIIGVEMITGWDNDPDIMPYAVFTSDGPIITSAIATGEAICYNEGSLSVTAGKQYKITVDITLNSGEGPLLLFYYANSEDYIEFGTLSSGHYEFTFEALGTDIGWLALQCYNASNYSANISCREE